MRAITKQSVGAFVNARPFKSGNTRVEVRNGEVFFYLFDNMIAHKYEGGLYVTTCGWKSNTTKERLNGILRAYNLGSIFQNDFVWYLNAGYEDVGREFNNKRFEL